MTEAIDITKTASITVSDGDKADNIDFPDFFESETGAIYVEFARLSTGVNFQNTSGQTADFNIVYQLESGNAISTKKVDTVELRGLFEEVNGVIDLNQYIQNGTSLTIGISSNNYGDINGDQTIDIELEIVGRRAI